MHRSVGLLILLLALAATEEADPRPLPPEFAAEVEAQRQAEEARRQTSTAPSPGAVPSPAPTPRWPLAVGGCLLLAGILIVLRRRRRRPAAAVSEPLLRALRQGLGEGVLLWPAPRFAGSDGPVCAALALSERGVVVIDHLTLDGDLRIGRPGEAWVLHGGSAPRCLIDPRLAQADRLRQIADLLHCQRLHLVPMLVLDGDWRCETPLPEGVVGLDDLAAALAALPLRLDDDRLRAYGAAIEGARVR